MRGTIVMALMGVSGWLAMAAAAPPVPWPGPRGNCIFIEGESFKPEGHGWQVVEREPGYQAPDLSSLKALSGAAAGDGKAIHTATIPADGTYHLWLRMNQKPEEGESARLPFRVTIEQAGRPVFDQTYDTSLLKEVSPPSYFPYRWVVHPAKLAKGPAKIVISKLGAESGDPSLRQVDCLLLTTDDAYQADYRDFTPQTYVRFRVHAVSPAKVYFFTFLNHKRPPWYENLYFGKTNYFREQLQAPADQLLAAGDSTPWLNISRLLYTDSDTSFQMQASVTYAQDYAVSSDFSVDFATAPRDSAIVRTLRRKGRGAGMVVLAPPDLTQGRKPKADMDFARETTGMIGRFEPIPFGRRPTKFPLMMQMGITDRDFTAGVRTAELAAFKYMGINGAQAEIDEQDVRDGLRFGLLSANIWFMESGEDMREGGHIFNLPQLDKIEATLKPLAEKMKASPLAQNHAAFLLIDEAAAHPLDLMAAREPDHAAFRRWLAEKGYKPRELGAASWKAVKMVADPKAKPPLRYLLSQKFRVWTIAHFFRQTTDIVRAGFPPSIKTTQNFSDGAVYLANMYMQGNDYYVWFKDRALDVAMSEDWTSGGVTQQLCGWNVALLRSATKYHGQPIHMYVITSFDRTPLDVKLKAYTDLAQGAKLLNFYAYSPTYQSHEPGWYHRWPMYPAVAEVCHEIGAAEEILIDAMPRKAETAIIYSIPHDIWSVDIDCTQGNERMMTYLALRHAQVPVDVLSDEDARTGHLTGYKAAYVFGEPLDAAIVKPLTEWVRAGGTLVLSPGAGSRNEVNQPSGALDEALGIKRQTAEMFQGMYATTLGLCQSLQPQGKATILDQAGQPDGEVDLMAWRQKFTIPDGAIVTARFEDGTPAAAQINVGKGRVVLVGFMPGLAYIRSAFLRYEAKRDELIAPLDRVGKVMAIAARAEGRKSRKTIPRHEYSGMPFEYSAAIRDLIVRPTREARVKIPAQVDTPQVEATFMTGEQGWAVPLANYTGSPLKQITVTLQPGDACGPIRSSRLGILTKEPIGNNGSITLTLPLESTDILYASWRRSG